MNCTAGAPRAGGSAVSLGQFRSAEPQRRYPALGCHGLSAPPACGQRQTVKPRCEHAGGYRGYRGYRGCRGCRVPHGGGVRDRGTGGPGAPLCALDLRCTIDTARPTSWAGGVASLSARWPRVGRSIHSRGRVATRRRSSRPGARGRRCVRWTCGAPSTPHDPHHGQRLPPLTLSPQGTRPSSHVTRQALRARTPRAKNEPNAQPATAIHQLAKEPPSRAPPWPGTRGRAAPNERSAAWLSAVNIPNKMTASTPADQKNVPNQNLQSLTPSPLP